MSKRRFFVGLLLLVPLVLAACAAQSGPRVGFISAGRLLVWQGEGASPDQKLSGTTGTVGYLNEDGSVEPLIEIPTGAAGVQPCGNGSTSPDDQYFAFHMNVPQAGNDSGALYLVKGTGEAQLVREDVEALACAGNGTFQFSPDSRRFGFIAYNPLQPNSEFISGNLFIYDADSLEELRGFGRVAAFDLGAAADASDYTDAEKVTSFIIFFTNASGAADEAGVYVWDGQNHTEITTLFPERGCRFTSAQITAVTGTRLAAVMGQRCNTGNTGTSWHLYTIDTAARSASKILNDFQQGGFFTNARTNNLYVTGNNGLLFTQADGISQNTVSMNYVDLDNPSTDSVIIERGGVMPRYEARRFVFPPNAPPVISPDGRWLAVITSTGTTVPEISIIDLNAAEIVPTTIPMVDRRDVIPEMLFSGDSSALYYVAGGIIGDDNSIFRVNLSDMSEVRLVASRFGQAVPAPGGNRIIATQYRRTEEDRPQPYTALVMVEGEGDPLTVFNGAITGEDGTVTRRFAYPLSWRP